MSSHATSSPKFRAFEFGVTRARVNQVQGTTYLGADQELLPYAHRMTDRLVHWAKTTPDRVLYARRDPAPVSYTHLTLPTNREV